MFVKEMYSGGQKRRYQGLYLSFLYILIQKYFNWEYSPFHRIHSVLVEKLCFPGKNMVYRDKLIEDVNFNFI